MSKFELKGWMKGALVGLVSVLALIFSLQTVESIKLVNGVAYYNLTGWNITNLIAPLGTIGVVGIPIVVGAILGWLLEKFD